MREGDSLSCLIGVDARAAAESGRPRIKLRQLMLEKCGKLTDEEMHTYLKAFVAPLGSCECCVLEIGPQTQSPDSQFRRWRSRLLEFMDTL